MDVVEPRFRKSSRCGGESGCVEVASAPHSFLLRDSKLGDLSPMLEFGSQSWSNFVAGVRAGEFD